MSTRRTLSLTAALGVAALAAWTSLDSLVQNSSQNASPRPTVQYAHGEIVDKYVVVPGLSSNLYGINMPKIVPVFGESNLSIRFFDTNSLLDVNMTVNRPASFNALSIGDKVHLEYAILQEPVLDSKGVITNYAVTGYRFKTMSKATNGNEQ